MEGREVTEVLEQFLPRESDSEQEVLSGLGPAPAPQEAPAGVLGLVSARPPNVCRHQTVLDMTMQGGS